MTAEQLAQARARREQKHVDKLAEDMPLFENEVRAGTFATETKNKLNRERRDREAAIK